MTRRRPWSLALSVWPGLPQIWSGQELLGLFLAAGFAASLNLAILGRFVWTELLDPAWPAYFGILAGTTWVLGLGYSAWWLWRCHPSRHRDDIDRLFREATEHYLGGRWERSRRLLEEILTLDDSDADALMQLGTLYARSGHPDLARVAFRQCLELEGGAKWRWEIAQWMGRPEVASSAGEGDPPGVEDGGPGGIG